MENMILVTGADGFIGKNLIRHLSNKHAVIGLTRQDYDLTQYSSWVEIAKKYNPAVIYHLAADSGGLFGNYNNSLKYFTNTLIINANLFHALERYSKDLKVIIPIAGCGYPIDASNPLTEDSLWDGLPHSASRGYSMAKKISNIAANEFNRSDAGRRIYTPLLANVFGPYDHFFDEDAHVIPSIISKLYKLRISSTPQIQLPGSGIAVRDFIYVEDVCKIMELYLYRDDLPVLMNLSAGNIISIRSLFNIIAKLVYPEVVINWKDDDMDGQLDKRFSNKLLKDIIPEFRFKDLENGLEQTVGWFNENLDAYNG